MGKEICSVCRCDDISKKGNTYVCEVCKTAYSKEEFEKLEKNRAEEENLGAAKTKAKKRFPIIPILAAIAVVALIAVFVMDGKEVQPPEEEPAAEYENSLTDLEFVSALEEAIYERVKINGQDNTYAELVETEEKILFGFDIKEYSSKKFEEQVLKYFEGLEIQKEYGAKMDAYLEDDAISKEDYEKFGRFWNEGAILRSQAMVYFMDNFGAFADMDETTRKVYRANADPEYWNLDDDIDRQMFMETRYETKDDKEYILYTNNSQTEINIVFWFKFYNGDTFVEQKDQEFLNVKPGDTIYVLRDNIDAKYTEKYLGWEYSIA